MSKTLQFRRGTTAQLSGIVGAQGELFVDLTKDTLVVMDGDTQGGQPLQKELVSGQTIKTISGESILGSGNITINGLDTILQDIVPSISEVYDIGSPNYLWYNGYFSNQISIGTNSISNIDETSIGISSENIVTNSNILADSLLLDELFISQNIITPLKTPLYGEPQLIVDGSLDVSGDWLKIPNSNKIIENPQSGQIRSSTENKSFVLTTPEKAYTISETYYFQ